MIRTLPTFPACFPRFLTVLSGFLSGINRQDTLHTDKQKKEDIPASTSISSLPY